MANLASMFSKKPEGEKPNESATKAEPQASAPATAPKKNPFAPNNDGDGRVATPGPDASVPEGSEAKPSNPLLGFKAAPSAEPTESKVTGAIDSLADLDAIEDAGTPPSESSGFADETPATKPTRELPEGLDKESLNFIDLIDGVYEVLHEPDMLGVVIRNIMMELNNHPEYMKLVSPDDIHQWVRGMRESMGLARIKKTEAKAKRSGGGGKKSKLVDADMLADLEDLGIAGLE